MNKYANRQISNLVLAGLMALAPTSAAAAQDGVSVDDIVAKYVEAVGGIEAHKSLKTRESEGAITIADVDVPWRMTILNKAPDKRHDQIEIPSYGVVTEGCDGKVAWKQEPGEGTRPLAGWELQNKLRDARFLGVIELMTEGELTYERQEMLEGKAHHVLNATYPRDGPWSAATYLLYIDENTHLLRVLRIIPKGVREFDHIDVEMSDYRAVDGIRIPFSTDISIDSNHFATLELNEVTHGIEVDDDLFAMPNN
jgi:hypothetical protein